jgi:hypothetical protein
MHLSSSSNITRVLFALLFIFTIQICSPGALPETTKPPVSIQDAISIADAFASKQPFKINKYFIASALLEASEYGSTAWKIRYELIYNPNEMLVSGSWFIVNVSMEKECTLHRGR